MALVYSEVQVELREVKLSAMPDSMLQVSPKATVPVLVLNDGTVVDESIDVIYWSLSQSDPQQWLAIDDSSRQLIQRFDTDFKPLLDCYKYADRHPRLTQSEHRARAEVFLSELDELLSQHACLSDDRCRVTDVAIFPFIRQFAGVDPAWFENCEYAFVRHWLNTMLGGHLFHRVMQKNRFWQLGDAVVYL